MTDLEADLQQAARHYRNAATVVPYYTIGKVLMPGGKRPALVVPLDGDYVVSSLLDRSPYNWLLEKMRGHIDLYRSFLDCASKYLDFSDVLDASVDDITPFLPNSYFHTTDALSLTTILVENNPKKYIEIGSGNSTRFARRAVKNYNLSTKIICIDPNPRSNVDAVADESIKKSLLDVDLSVFTELDAGDILFLDGSHLVFNGTDTTFFFLRILPIIQKGILVHIHDIFLPYEYPEACDRLRWNEQYLVAAIFQHKPVSDIIAPVQFMYKEGLCQEGASFWFTT